MNPSPDSILLQTMKEEGKIMKGKWGEREQSRTNMDKWVMKVVLRALMLPPLVLMMIVCFWVASSLLPVCLLQICVSAGPKSTYCLSATSSKSNQIPMAVPTTSQAKSHDTNNLSTISNLLRSRLQRNNVDTRLSSRKNNKVKDSGSQDYVSATQQRKHSSSSAAAGTVLQLKNENVVANNSIPNGLVQQQSNTSSSPANTGMQEGSHWNQSVGMLKESNSNEVAYAHAVASDYIQRMRQMALPLPLPLTNANSQSQSRTSCEGRRIYMYKLPPKFNTQMVRHCRDLLAWQNMCQFLSNAGMGEPITMDHCSNSSSSSSSSTPTTWYNTHQYSLEVLFHARMMRYPCLTAHAAQADLFYVPFYAGLHVLSYHFGSNNNNKNNSDGSDSKNAAVAEHEQERDRLGYELLWWLKQQQWWQRRHGADHVFVLGKVTWDFRRSSSSSWGTNFLGLKDMELPLKLLIEREPWQMQEIAVPHPTFFHPRRDSDIVAWQNLLRNMDRPYVVGLAAATRQGGVRGKLIQSCQNNTAECRFLNCQNGACFHPHNTTKVFLSSEFCLQPPGDSPTRRSVFDSLISGCIPVLLDPFTAYFQYAWHLPANESYYSVYIPKESILDGTVNVVDILRKIPSDRRRQMRSFIIDHLVPGLVYGDPDAKFEQFQDAFDISINNLLWRLRNQQQQDSSASASGMA